MPLSSRPASNLLPFLLLSFSSGIVYLFLIGFSGEAPLRSAFGLWAAAYTFLSLNMLLAYHMAKTAELVKVGIAAGLLFRLLMVFSLPELSDDYFRFLWDGQLVVDGQNPYSQLPTAINESNPEFLSHIFAQLNSPNYFSVYPPLLQSTFALAVKLFPHNLFAAVVSMKLVLWLCELGSILLLFKLLQTTSKTDGKTDGKTAGSSLPQAGVLLYAWNPLPIIEACGNLHFEAAMLFFTLLCLWFLKQQKSLLAGAVFGLAIGVKLIPLMLLPLFLVYLGWKKGTASILAALTIAILPFLLFWDEYLLQNFSTSLALYFSNFEFNGSIYYLLRSIFYVEGQAHPIHLLSSWLKPITVGLILLVPLLRLPKKQYGWAVSAMFMLAIYHFFATTVHPWYLIPLLGLSLLGRFRFPLLWSLLIFGTYINYQGGGYLEETWWIIIEYGLVYGMLLYELLHKNQLFKGVQRRQIKARARIKLARVLPWLIDPAVSTPAQEPSDFRVLDIGTGNGGVAFGLQQKGLSVKTVDVVDKAFFDSTKPQIYDGEHLPYADASFDCCNLLTILHHCQNPEQVLQEAVRVSAAELILIEDTYTSNWQKWLTYRMDSLVNWEFAGHPHTNKSEAEWESLFAQLGLQILEKRKDKVLLVFEQISWKLGKTNSP